jgi:hypothetical protein
MAINWVIGRFLNKSPYAPNRVKYIFMNLDRLVQDFQKQD